jgi:hypothetical protein
MPPNLKLRTNSSQCIDVAEIQVRFILSMLRPDI